MTIEGGQSIRYSLVFFLSGSSAQIAESSCSLCQTDWSELFPKFAISREEGDKVRFSWYVLQAKRTLFVHHRIKNACLNFILISKEIYSVICHPSWVHKQDFSAFHAMPDRGGWSYSSTHPLWLAKVDDFCAIPFVLYEGVSNVFQICLHVKFVHMVNV